MLNVILRLGHHHGSFYAPLHNTFPSLPPSPSPTLSPFHPFIPARRVARASLSSRSHFSWRILHSAIAIPEHPPTMKRAGFHGCWKHRINIVPLTWKDFAAALFNYDRFVGPLFSLPTSRSRNYGRPLHSRRGGCMSEEEDGGGGEGGRLVGARRREEEHGRRVFHGEGRGNFWCG